MDNNWKIGLKLAALVVVAVWLVKTFLVTSCFIPSSGMENTLYQGEGVLVNKWSYGLRMPFPSFLGYHRIGSCEVEKGDIVLFNDPGATQRNKRLEWRRVFISRCIGTPGDTLMLNREMIDSGDEVLSPDSKALYVYPASKEDLMRVILDAVGLKENPLIGYTEDGGYIRSFSHYEFYLVSQKAGQRIDFVSLNSKLSQEVHPYVVPRKGESVKVYPWNVVLLCNTIVSYEGKQAGVRGDTLWVEGKPVSSFTFSKDYYWMASNDPVNLCDSRLFGFVPEDHVIGKAWRIWYTPYKGRFFQRIQ